MVRIRFHPEAGAGADELEAAMGSASSLKSYAAVAVPRTGGETGETGRRAFCIDSTGVIRVTQDGNPPTIAQGLCSESTPALR